MQAKKHRGILRQRTNVLPGAGLALIFLFLFQPLKKTGMNTEQNRNQGNNSNQQGSAETGDVNQDQVQISQPRIERAEGPFEHSGETSGWTKEEAEEKEQQEDSEQQG